MLIWLRNNRRLLLRYCDPQLTKHHLLGLLRQRIFFREQFMHRYSPIITSKPAQPGAQPAPQPVPAPVLPAHQATVWPALTAAPPRPHSCNPQPAKPPATRAIFPPAMSAQVIYPLSTPPSLLNRVLNLLLNQRQRLLSLLLRLRFSRDLLLRYRHPLSAIDHLLSQLQQWVFHFKQHLHR